MAVDVGSSSRDSPVTGTPMVQPCTAIYYTEPSTLYSQHSASLAEEEFHVGSVALAPRPGMTFVQFTGGGLLLLLLLLLFLYSPGSYVLAP
jgi:hypothetical protein